MKKKKLKLYVWQGVLSDYTSGIAFALATSPDHARKLVKKKDNCVFDTDLAEEPEVYTSAVGFAVFGGG